MAFAFEISASDVAWLRGGVVLITLVMKSCSWLHAGWILFAWMLLRTFLRGRDRPCACPRFSSAPMSALTSLMRCSVRSAGLETCLTHTPGELFVPKSNGVSGKGTVGALKTPPSPTPL